MTKCTFFFIKFIAFNMTLCKWGTEYYMNILFFLNTVTVMYTVYSSIPHTAGIYSMLLYSSILHLAGSTLPEAYLISLTRRLRGYKTMDSERILAQNGT